MDRIINHNRLRYLLLIPIVFTIAAIMYFSGLTREINRTLLEEKAQEKQLELDLICDQIDAFIELDADWGRYDYRGILGHSLAFLDAQPFTFAALYDSDLREISRREPSYEGSPFDPLSYPEFLPGATSNESGHFILPFTPHGEPERDMHLYYRWVPTDVNLSGRFLTVIAISEYSVSNHAADWVGWGAMAMIVATLILNTVMVAVISRLGYIYQARNGTKWRNAREN